MSLKYKAIKVGSLPLYDYDESVEFETYLVSIPFAELIKICKIKSISTNRSVDEFRAAKMVKYIKQRSAFYPPIIISTCKKDQINFNTITSEISICNATNDTNSLTIIDGQHRYKSIELLMEQDGTCGKNQAVFIINGISDLKRREIFIDINDNAKRVSTGDKERYKISLANYFGLLYLKNYDNIQHIDWGANQMKPGKKFPYKFIVKSIGIILEEHEKSYKRGEISLTDISWFGELNKNIWDAIFEKYYEDEKVSKLFEAEVVLLSLFRLYKPIYCEKTKESMESSDDTEIDTVDLSKEFLKIFNKFLEKTEEIQVVNNCTSSVKEKKEQLNTLFREWMWVYA